MLPVVPQSMPTRATLTGLVLAGGRALRMGGVDKGLQDLRGEALAARAIARLAPQVSEVMVSANRNEAIYRTLAARVLADATDDFPGPLAGMLSGLRAAATPWLVVTPCDAPWLPLDLVQRLADAIASRPGTLAAVVERDQGPALGRRLEPVCCLLSTTLADDLQAYLASGERKVERWLSRHAMPVAFDRPGDAAAFANFNTLDDLQR